MKYMKKTILAFVMIFTIPHVTWARPKAVILFRHGEEPKDKSSNHLSETGYLRAQLLPQLFETNSVLKKLGLPVALFAAGAKNKNKSIRSIETLVPLSLVLKIPINDRFIRDDFHNMTNEINNNPDYDDQVVVVTWTHKILKDIAEDVGLKKAPTYPSGQFDRIWVITFDGGKKGQKAVLQDLPQQLLPGDSKK